MINKKVVGDFYYCGFVLTSPHIELENGEDNWAKVMVRWPHPRH
jgi:hypothetical protein